MKFSSIRYWATDPKTHNFTWMISALRTADSAFANQMFDSVAWNTLDPEIGLIELNLADTGIIKRKYKNPQLAYDIGCNSGAQKYFSSAKENG
jgi:hypothetical protein